MACLLVLSFSPFQVVAETVLTWKKAIEPLLDRECVKCHGPLKKKGGLDLSTFQALLRGGDSGPVLQPGAPKQSRLLQVLAPEADPHMPPKKQLGDQDRELLASWVAHLDRPTPLPAVPVDAANLDSQLDQSTGSNFRERIDHLPAHQIVDSFIREEWLRRQIVPAPLCDDRTFLRRISLDLTGEGPDHETAERFLFDGSPDKRSRLIDQLLASKAYARNMRESFDLLLLGRKGFNRSEQRRQNQWHDYLESVFADNRPWDKVIREIILARQAPQANAPRPHQGALWFLYEQKNNHQAIAESLSPIVFGTQIACAQCHDHPLAHEIKQAHYWGLVTAFNRSKNVSTEAGIGIAESAIGGFINFANLEQESQPAQLVFLNGKEIDEPRPQPDEKEVDSPDNYIVPPAKKDEKPPRAAIPRFSRRERLADAVTRSNPLLARAFVNHLWALLFGRGIVHPYDEINSKHPPSHPALLDWLADYFESTGYDIRHLAKVLTQSQTYQLAASQDPQHAQHPDAFASALEKPLKAETLFRLLLRTTGHEEQNYIAAFPQKARTLREAIITQFPDLLPTSYQATLQQAMLLTNSPELDHLLNARPGNLTQRLIAIEDSDARIRATFMGILGRLPTGDEAHYVRGYLNKRADRPVKAQKQLIWSLLCSPEFLLNH